MTKITYNILYNPNGNEQLEQFKIYCCRVCGFNYKEITENPKELPWHEDGTGPTFEICVCCGCEWGYNDYKKESILKYREEWKKIGRKFFMPEFCPPDWDVEVQISMIPPEFWPECQ